MIVMVGELIEKLKEFDTDKEIEISTLGKNYLINEVIEDEGVVYLTII